MGEILITWGEGIVAVMVIIWKALYFIWWRPKKVEKYLRQQGIKGPPYKLFYGNQKETVRMINEALSKPINLSHDIVPRVFLSLIKPSRIMRMLPAFYISCEELVGRWKKLVVAEGLYELDVWPELQNLTGDVISRTAFGSSYEEGRRIFQLQKELVVLVMQVFQSIYIPRAGFLPTKRNIRMKEIDKEIRGLLTGMINKREKAIKIGEATADDLLGLLMESNIKEIQEHGNSKNVGMSIEEVIQECKLFYFAGQETTSVLLLWTMVVLSMYPDWQTRAREEVLQVFGKGKPDFDGLNHLKIRFSEGISTATKNQVSFFPFSWGPRICIGQNFAMIEAKMALSMILQNFSFELSATYAHAPCINITLQPQYGAQMILHKL